MDIDTLGTNESVACMVINKEFGTAKWVSRLLLSCASAPLPAIVLMIVFLQVKSSSTGRPLAPVQLVLECLKSRFNPLASSHMNSIALGGQ